MAPPLSTEVVLRLIAAAVPDMARRAVAQQVRRLGFVDQDQVEGVPFTSVLVDGDDAPLSALSMTGVRLRRGDRVLVDFYPPHGVVISGVLAEAPWFSAWGVVSGGQASGTGVAFNVLSPTQLSLLDVPVVAGRRYDARMTFRARSTVADTLVQLALQLDTGSGFASLRNVPLTFAQASVINMSEGIQWVEPFDAASDGTVDLRVVSTRLSSTSSDTTPDLVKIEVADVGPTP